METNKNFYDDFPIDSWLLMKSPLHLLSIIIFYLYFVLKLGPQLMEKRPPFQLKNILIIYNAYQVLFSTWLCSKLFLKDNSVKILMQCDHTKHTKAEVEEIMVASWWYFFSKVIDLLDTIFFVLRKKQSHVTFLHLYHHILLVIFTWIYVKYLPSGQGPLLALINSFVHIVMYSYYLMAVIKPQKYIWWKKYVTWLQLIQFMLGIPILTYFVVMDCNIPNALLWFYVFNMFFFLYLFGDFYIKSYNKRDTN